MSLVKLNDIGDCEIKLEPTKLINYAILVFHNSALQDEILPVHSITVLQVLSYEISWTLDVSERHGELIVGFFLYKVMCSFLGI